MNICLLSTVYWKDENIEKEAGNGSFFVQLYFEAEHILNKTFNLPFGPFHSIRV